MNKLRYFSMYSGIGGFELGIQRAFDNRPDLWNGLEDLQDHSSDSAKPQARAVCIGYSEIDKYAIKVYERQFNGHTNYGNADTINEKELPDFDLLVGGFPCQSFSIAGKRKGFNDTRGTQFFNIARILAEKRPRHLVLENVKGLLSHEQGKTFQTILGVLSDLGYRVEWQVLNSKNFGVPQNRERVYIVGHLGNECGRKVFPIGSDDSKDTRKLGQELAPTLDANYYKGWSPNGQQSSKRQHIKQLNQPTHSNDRVYASDGISPTLNTMQGGNRQPFVSLRVQGDVDKRKVYTSDIAATLAANPTSDNTARTTDGVRIRRLTPIECERLQGFPDNWTAEGIDGPISDTQRYKMCGNAVTVNVVEAVMERLYEAAH